MEPLQSDSPVDAARAARGTAANTDREIWHERPDDYLSLPPAERARDGYQMRRLLREEKP